MNCLSAPILAYGGTQKDPVWVDVDPRAYSSYFALLHLIVRLENYSTACTVEVDTASLPVQTTTSATGARYFEIGFEVILLFGLTELQAQIAYRQNVRRDVQSDHKTH